MTDPRIFGLMVTRNEANRYLTRSVPWLKMLTDDCFVYDDRSDDGTFEILQEFGIGVQQRRKDQPGFTDHEGLFRQQAWDAMTAEFRPTHNDWILVMDADELLVVARSPHEAPTDRYLSSCRRSLRSFVEQAAPWTKGLSFMVQEIWSLDPFLRRIDGHWRNGQSVRLARWSRDAQMSSISVGCGSVPEHVLGVHRTDPTLEILHLGYSDPDDRAAKFERYWNQPGRSPRHVASIQSPYPELCSPDIHPLVGNYLRTGSGGCLFDWTMVQSHH